MTNRRTVIKNLVATSVALPATKLFAGDTSPSKQKQAIETKRKYQSFCLPVDV